MKYDRLLQCFEEIASGMPEDWDNSGIQIRTDKEEIERVLVCLEVTPEVVREAMELETDLIIAHHPLIFGGVEHLNTGDVHEKMILDLVAAGIDVYAAHITFDKAPLGNSFFLADLLGFDDLAPVDDLPLVVGRLQPSMTLGELFLHTADMMDLRPGQIRAAGDRSQQIYRAAVCTGAGSEFMEEALAAGCQVLITGDVKYHEAMRAKELGIGVIDAGHYGTEKYFAENFAAQLRDLAGEELDVLESSVNIDPFMV